MARTLDLTPRPLPSWEWYAPDASLTAREYSAAIMANARKYAKAPETLPFNVSTGEVRPMRQSYSDGKGYVIALTYMAGTGWGGQSREAVATWEGGKRWTLTGLNRGKAAEALATLALPEVDGRYLLRNAPPCPVRGKAAWKARWTVSRKALTGLTAVASEGIDDSAVQRRMQDVIDRVKGQESAQRDRYESAVAQLAELPPMHDVAMRYGRLRARLLRFANISADDCNYNSVRHLIMDRRQESHTARHDALVARATERVWPFANTGHGMAYGVRCTRADGTPNHKRGPFQEAHEVGVTATAPDWDDAKVCGYGLHYIPFRDEDGRLRDLGDCVAWALQYGDASDFALWIVKAGEMRVMIDGHKGKAQHLTPLEHIGSVSTNAQRSHPAILNTLVDFYEGAKKREQLAYQRDESERYVAEYARQVKDLTAALREYRKARKA